MEHTDYISINVKVTRRDPTPRGKNKPVVAVASVGGGR